MAAPSSLADTHPELVKEWHPSLNNFSPNDVTSGSGKRAYWRCRQSDLHVWDARIQHRADAGSGCPYCSGKEVCDDNNLAYVDPGLAKEVYPASKLSAREVTSGSSQHLTWQCSAHASHIWDDSVKHRRAGRGCPFCANKRVSSTNSLVALFPEIAKEFDTVRNGKTPDQVIAGENTDYWWTCSQAPDHQWSARTTSRTFQGNGCPFCAGQRVSVSNSLERFPRIAAEFHPYKNDTLTAKDLTAGTTKHIWWLCSRDSRHEWQATVVSRTRGTGCPKCSPLFQSRTEIELAAELSIHFMISLDDHEISLGHRNISADIIIRDLKIAIEYDGHHWHKDRGEEDRTKNVLLNKAGWKLVRIREKPLPKISDGDCVVEKLPPKRLADAVLIHLDSVFGLRSKIFRDYLGKCEPQAAATAHEHLEKVFKAEHEKFLSGLIEFRRFKDLYGRTPVPQDHLSDSGLELGKWCARIRLLHSRNELSPRQEKELLNAGFSFSPFEDAWERHFAALLSFIATYGHANVGHGNMYFFEGEEIGLGSWISNQRSKRTVGVGSARGELRPERFSRLDAVPQWRWDGREK